MSKIRDLLNFAINELEGISPTALLDSEMILGYLIKKDRLFLIINKDYEVEKIIEDEYKKFIDIRKKGIPVQYIIKSQEFMGINFFVDFGILIPRSDTEILVEEVINLSKDYKEPSILDLGTGSGAISVSLAKNIKNSKIIAVDISKKAIEIATLNSKNNNVLEKIKIIESDLFSNIPNEYLNKFDIIVSNPPYIPKEEIEKLQKEVQNEPVLALDGGLNGLDFYKRIVEDGYKYISTGGYLAVEVGHDQSEEVKKIMDKYGYRNIKFVKDLSGIDRVVVGRKL